MRRGHFDRRFILCAWVVAIYCPQTFAALAQDRIGVAAMTKNDVAQVQGTRRSPIGQGDGIFRDEVVRTGVVSAARLVFSDKTNLSIGPTATVTLDKFVFAGETSYSKATVELSKGAMRFVTGQSNKPAYEIKTPVATIGVRGTIVDIRHQNGETTVALQQGAVTICWRKDEGRCIDLLHAGDRASVTSKSAPRQLAQGTGGWSFASLCATDAALCATTTTASNSSPEEPNGAPPSDVADAALAVAGTAAVGIPAVALGTTYGESSKPLTGPLVFPPSGRLSPSEPLSP
jgi:hypothetical protein